VQHPVRVIVCGPRHEPGRDRRAGGVDLSLLISVVLLGLVGWGLWQVVQPRSVFVIRIEAGHPRVVRGTVTRSFLSQVDEICQHHGVSQGTIRGQARASQIALEMSGPFPAPCRQQIRNLWVMSGWATGTSRRRP
jgi:hypothetical protein